MHRIHTATALVVSAVLISVSADARPIEIRELVIKSSVNSTRTQVDLSRMTTIRWKPGLVSTNVRIRPRALRAAPRAGEKGGTADINIGIGELQECTISKSMDAASPLLGRLARTHRPLPQIVLIGKDAKGHALTYKLKNVYITSYQIGAAGRRTGRRETATISFTGLE